MRANLDGFLLTGGFRALAPCIVWQLEGLPGATFRGAEFCLVSLREWISFCFSINSLRASFAGELDEINVNSHTNTQSKSDPRTFDEQPLDIYVCTVASASDEDRGDQPAIYKTVNYIFSHFKDKILSIVISYLAVWMLTLMQKESSDRTSEYFIFILNKARTPINYVKKHYRLVHVQWGSYRLCGCRQVNLQSAMSTVTVCISILTVS